ncbi:unnamed protein product [Enterobius vermicularis]|uniref:Aa_trans domain-containing protein n=1 Tax=Enterobius vermicularis TaxID=51028 RepID=A0A0N4V4Y6_ENTVE|nr:unnamed protein product [Enterobius vermicularis]
MDSISSPNETYLLVSEKNVADDQAVLLKKKHRNSHGMGWIVTCLFIVGETAGGGLIAMPTAMVSTGLTGGIAVVILGAIICTYTSLQLSENWTILQQRWTVYRTHCRKPYPVMGYRAIGPKFMHFVSFCLNVTMFGAAAVFLLLAAKNFEDFLHVYGDIRINFCYLVIVVAVVMFPLTLFRSPKDFWWAVIAAMVTTTTAVVLIIIGASIDLKTCIPHNNYPSPQPSRFFMSLGTVMFAYGGHGTFPTIQHDMTKPYHFCRSAIIGFVIICSLYLPVSILGYYSYGDSLRDSVIPSLQNVWIQQAVNVLITLHVFLALTILFNPMNQELEEALNIPHEFGVKRLICRTAVMVTVVVAAETVPEFGVLLDFVGGSTITLMAIVFPIVFNLYLYAGHRKHSGKPAAADETWITMTEIYRYTPKGRLALNLIVLAIGIVVGMAASWAALEAMISAEFSTPCYARLFTATSLEKQFNNSTYSAHGKVNCCGIFKNVTSLGPPTEFCLKPAFASFESSSG